MRTAVSTPGAHDQPLPILECRTDTKTTSRFRLPVVSLCMCTQPFCWHRAQTPPRSDRRLAGQASGRLCHGAASQLLALPPQLCFRDCWQPAEDVQHPAQGVQTCTWQARPLQHIILRLQPSGSCSSIPILCTLYRVWRRRPRIASARLTRCACVVANSLYLALILLCNVCRRRRIWRRRRLLRWLRSFAANMRVRC